MATGVGLVVGSVLAAILVIVRDVATSSDYHLYGVANAAILFLYMIFIVLLAGTLAVPAYLCFAAFGFVHRTWAFLGKWYGLAISSVLCSALIALPSWLFFARWKVGFQAWISLAGGTIAGLLVMSRSRVGPRREG